MANNISVMQFFFFLSGLTKNKLLALLLEFPQYDDRFPPDGGDLTPRNVVFVKCNTYLLNFSLLAIH